NGHGGNAAANQVVLESFGARHPGCRVVTTSWWRVASERLADITETGPGGVGHACEFETSLLLHFAPRLVRTGKVGPGGNRPTFPWSTGDMLRGSAASLYRSFEESTEGGVFGDPTAASAAKGSAIEEAVVETMSAVITSLQDGSSEAP